MLGPKRRPAFRRVEWRFRCRLHLRVARVRGTTISLGQNCAGHNLSMPWHCHKLLEVLVDHAEMGIFKALNCTLRSSRGIQGDCCCASRHLSGPNAEPGRCPRNRSHWYSQLTSFR